MQNVFTYVIVERALSGQCRHDLHAERVVEVLGELLVATHPIGPGGVPDRVSDHLKLVDGLAIFSY